MDKRVNMKAVPQVQGINMWCSASICQKCQEHIILESVFTFPMGFLTVYLSAYLAKQLNFQKDTQKVVGNGGCWGSK